MHQYLLGVYEKSMPDDLTLYEKLNEARLAGYDYMDLALETEADLDRLEWQTPQIVRALDDQTKANLAIKSISLLALRRFPLGHPDPAVQKKGLCLVERTIRLGLKLGAHLIQISGYDVYDKPSDDETKRNFARNITQAARMSSRGGAILAFRTTSNEFLNTIDKANVWLGEIQSPYLQIYPNLCNLVSSSLKYGTDVLMQLERGRGHLAAIDLTDNELGDPTGRLYRQPFIDLSAMIQKTRELGVNLFLARFYHNDAENWRETMRENNRYLRKIITEHDDDLD